MLVLHVVMQEISPGYGWFYRYAALASLKVKSDSGEKEGECQVLHKSVKTNQATLAAWSTRWPDEDIDDLHIGR